MHIALREYGIDAFRRFVQSYRDHPAGRAHDLLIAAKQFDSEEAFAPCRDALDGLRYKLIWVPDGGFDLGTYFYVARETRYRSYCFLNSLSEILVDGWLDKLASVADAAPGGVVGASASWRSVSSEVRRFIRDMPLARWPAFLRPLRRIAGVVKIMMIYPLFPNPHLRTNTFLIERRTLLSLNEPVIRTKPDSSRLEHGWRSLTRQILKRRGQVLVVDAHGRSFAAADWPASQTFWQGEQEGLLVADKQTRLYIDADEAERQELRRGAWGPS